MSLNFGSTLVMPPVAVHAAQGATVPSPPNTNAMGSGRVPSPRDDLPNNVTEGIDWRKHVEVTGPLDTARVIIVVSNSEYSLSLGVQAVRSILSEQRSNQFTLLLNQRLEKERQISSANLISQRVVQCSQSTKDNNLKALQKQVSAHQGTLVALRATRYLNELETNMKELKLIDATQASLNREIQKKGFIENLNRKVILFVKTAFLESIVQNTQSSQKGFLAIIKPSSSPSSIRRQLRLTDASGASVEQREIGLDKQPRLIVASTDTGRQTSSPTIESMLRTLRQGSTVENTATATATATVTAAATTVT